MVMRSIGLSMIIAPFILSNLSLIKFLNQSAIELVGAFVRMNPNGLERL